MVKAIYGTIGRRRTVQQKISGLVIPQFDAIEGKWLCLDYLHKKLEKYRKIRWTEMLTLIKGRRRCSKGLVYCRKYTLWHTMQLCLISKTNWNNIPTRCLVSISSYSMYVRTHAHASYAYIQLGLENGFDRESRPRRNVQRWSRIV